MKAKITITPDSNVDYNKHLLKDMSNVRTVVMDWTDAVEVEDKRTGRTEKINISHLSMFDHVMILHGERVKPLAMLSKENF